MIADMVFVIEGTSDVGNHIEEVVRHYIQPTLNFFKDKSEKFTEAHPDEIDAPLMQYAVVFYQATENPLEPPAVTFGPSFSMPGTVEAIMKFPFKLLMRDTFAKLSEGLAAAHCCFEAMRLRRDTRDLRNVQRHVLLVASSRPLDSPVQHCHKYKGETLDPLVSRFDERDVNFSIICLRKIPEVYRLFLRAVGERILSVENFAVNHEHTVLLRGINLKKEDKKAALSEKNAASTSSKA